MLILIAVLTVGIDVVDIDLSKVLSKYTEIVAVVEFVYVHTPHMKCQFPSKKFVCIVVPVVVQREVFLHSMVAVLEAPPAI